MATEIDEIIKHIEKSNNNFLLSGGAGSGKTYTLIELLNRIYNRHPEANIACITYTNVAADEILERTNFENLFVSTIHDFLWNNIRNFQINLKDSFLKLYSEKTDTEESIERIDYREYRSYRNGVISHDEVIKISEYMFKEYPLLSKILKDKYDFILIDEYQDTFKEVIDIFFNYVDTSKGELTIGLFGDSMQSIFNRGIGNVSGLLDKEDSSKIKEIFKKINRRNPQKVIDLANKIRVDKLKQKAEINNNAPNNLDNGNIKTGNVKFLYSKNNDIEIKQLKSLNYFKDWDFQNPKKNKELYLSYSLIAGKAGFSNLMNIYSKDYIFVGDSSYRKRVQKFIENFSIKDDFSERTFIEVINTCIKTVAEKLNFDTAMDYLLGLINEKTDTYRKAQNVLKKSYPGLEQILPTETQNNFINSNPGLFQTVKESNFLKVKKTYIDRKKLIGKKRSSNEESNKRNDERDLLIKHLLKIQDILYLFENKKYFELLRKVDFKIRTANHKIELNQKLKEIYNIRCNNIESVLNLADTNRVCIIDDKLKEFIDNNKYLYKRIKDVNFEEIINLFKYVENYTVYSTQQGIKGAEFNNVLVSLDGGRAHTDFSYEHLFKQTIGKEEIIERTKKLFYVCCTRAKENLVVFYNIQYTNDAIKLAERWFGEDNVKNVDNEIC